MTSLHHHTIHAYQICYMFIVTNIHVSDIETLLIFPTWDAFAHPASGQDREARESWHDTCMLPQRLGPGPYCTAVFSVSQAFYIG